MPVEDAPRRTIRLHTVFAVILLAVLLLPLSGVYFFRIYETELVRQTEQELITQAVFISSIYKQEFRKIPHKPAEYGNPVNLPPLPQSEKYKPVTPLLDLRYAEVYPPRPDGVKSANAADLLATGIGKHLQPILEEARLSTLAGMRVLDPRGVVIAGHTETGLSLADLPEVAAALGGKYSSIVRRRESSNPKPSIASLSRGTVIRVFMALPITYHERVIGVVYLSRSPRNVLKALYEERDSIGHAGLFIFLMTAAIGWVLSYTIGRPLSALRRHAEKLTLGEKPVEKLRAPPIEELVSLTRSFEKLSSTIESRSEYIRSFAMHVAHEFKTPLTSIQGAVELMHDHPDDMKPDQRRRFLTNILKDAERLKKLVSRLLELARADVMQPRSEATDAAVLLDDLQKKYSAKVAVTAPEGPLPVSIGPDILETVLVNLIENSLQHGAKKVEIDVAVTEQDVVLDVTDDGSGISEGNASRLFTPFFTTRRETGGTGLGLTITKSLLNAYGGSISYVSGKTGARFRIILKAAGTGSSQG